MLYEFYFFVGELSKYLYCMIVFVQLLIPLVQESDFLVQKSDFKCRNTIISAEIGFFSAQI